MAIPRIIHQTWKDEHVPARFRAFTDSWKIQHPDWEYQYWTDDRNREFIKARHPYFLLRYDSYVHQIQKIDAVRYLLLFTFGGLYVDLDFECFRPLDELLVDRQCLFGLEPQEHCAMHRRDRIISNALMAAEPGHPFLRAIIDDLLFFESCNPDRNDLILETTGPFMLERVYHHCGAATGVTLLPSKLLHPLTIFEAEQVAAHGWTAAVREKITDAYAVHYHAGTWWRG